jgi:lauroyl/myristoyl acyltransferase
MVDWEFEGIQHFDQLRDAGHGAIILTAHMGNYDLGAYLFVERIKRPMTIVRAPEQDPETQRWEQERRRQLASEDIRVDFNTEPGMLALDLIQALRERKIVAIQGDRVTPGISTFPSTLFGRRILLPSGPFALAMATQTPIHPLFVLRVGWMQYRVVTTAPFECVRTGRDRDRDIEKAIAHWSGVLQTVISKHWSKWHMFEPFDTNSA